MSKEFNYWSVLVLQMLSTAALIRMGTELTVVAKDDWSHPARRLHIYLLGFVTVVQWIGVLMLRSLNR